MIKKRINKNVSRYQRYWDLMLSKKDITSLDFANLELNRLLDIEDRKKVSVTHTVT